MCRNVLYTLISLLGCMLFGGLAVGCAPEDYGEEHKEGGMKSTSYVSLSLVSAPGVSTRSNPTGGEDGDGQEKGQEYENRINSAVAFFFQSENGVNGAAGTLIQAVASFSFQTEGSDGSVPVDRTYTTEPQPITLENGIYQVLVVANPGTDWWSRKPSLTLGEVRDYIQTQAWTVSGSDNEAYSDFVMTSAADATFTLESNPKESPATAIVNVERMAARLDYKAEDSYDCTDPAYPAAKVEITGAALVNNLTAGSYLMKRVADNVSGSPLSYLGTETADADGVATNYVLDPWTADKTEANNNFTIGGTSGRPASALYGTWFEGGSADPNWWAGYVKAGTEVSEGTETWRRIGYTLENTTAAAEAGSRYSTGVVFKAKFHPKGVSNYQDGHTFFALGNRLFASMEDMMRYVYGADFTRFDTEIETCSSWADLKIFAASLLDNDPSGYKKFLSSQDETKDFKTVKDLLKWQAYMLNTCGYSATMSSEGIYSVTLNQNQLVTRLALKAYGVRTYEDATCYYTWWVRHSNDHDDTTKGIMEYAIVRNNIYKLMVKSIYSLGGEVPAPSENIILDVYVNDWLLLEKEILPM